jgi:hypothetical protein
VPRTKRAQSWSRRVQWTARGDRRPARQTGYRALPAGCRRAGTEGREAGEEGEAAGQRSPRPRLRDRLPQRSLVDGVSRCGGTGHRCRTPDTRPPTANTPMGRRRRKTMRPTPQRWPLRCELSCTDAGACETTLHVALRGSPSVGCARAVTERRQLRECSVERA